jgi:hypothetical protein
MTKRAKVQPRRVKEDPAFSFLDRSAVEYIIMGTCKSCKSLLYLGDRTCQRCGAPVGDSLTQEDLDRLYEMFEPQKPPPPVVEVRPWNPMMAMSSDSFCSYTTNAPMAFCSSNPYPEPALCSSNDDEDVEDEDGEDEDPYAPAPVFQTVPEHLWPDPAENRTGIRRVIDNLLGVKSDG